MVTRFVELAATKATKKGPHGKAQVEIKKGRRESEQIEKEKDDWVPYWNEERKTKKRYHKGNCIR